MMRLGVLDIGSVVPPRTHADVVRDCLDLAPLADELGYSRYWLAEHHSPSIAHASPEILLPLLAGLTTHLRVGTAGVLLGFHSPYRIAATFRLLAALFPSRIDLGLARGTPDGQAAAALLDGRTAPHGVAEHARRVERLTAALADEANLPPPLGVAPPEVWMLGSGVESACIAAQRGLALSLALFFPRPVGPAVLERYRAEFQPSRFAAQPRTTLAVAGACAETHAEACRMARQYRDGFIVPTVVGTPAACAEQLDELACRYGTDEIIFLDTATSLDDRSRTCQLLAAAVGLVPRTADRCAAGVADDR